MEEQFVFPKLSKEGQRCLRDALRQLHRVVNKIRGGQDSCNDFGELVRRYQDRLYNTMYRLVGDSQKAQDIVQETFLNAYQSLDYFKQESQLFTWLYRIAIDIAISGKREHRTVVSNDENERLIQEALNRLSPELRIVIVLKDMEELKYEEIAEILEVPIGTVRSRLHRARQELRDKFRE